MRLTLEGLNDKKSWSDAGVKLPEYDIQEIKNNTKKCPVWVHFGIDNIFRICIGGIDNKLI